MQKILLFIALLFSMQLNAQKIEGVWEGSLYIRGDEKTTMKVRMEIVERDSSYFGILYSRGVDKGTVYGCDYFITGSRQKNTVVFKWQKVQRAVAMNEYDCRLFRMLEVAYKKHDSVQSLQGSWVWEGSRKDMISCTKVSDVISDMAADEIAVYVNDLYAQYEDAGIALPVEDRFIKKAFEQEVDSSDVIIEISSIDSGKHDSVSVMFNGNPISEIKSLELKALRFRLKKLPVGVNDLLLVSESKEQSKLNIRVKIIHQGQVNMFDIQPGFTASALVLLNRKE